MTIRTSRRRSIVALLGALAIVLALGTSLASAAPCSVVWVGGHGAKWQTGANWSTSEQPKAGANVCLDNSKVAGSYTVVANGFEPAIGSISINGTGGATVSLLIDGQPGVTHGQLELSEQAAGSGVGAHGALDLGSTNAEVAGGTHGGVIVKAGTLVNEGTITSENTNDETPNYIDGNFDNVGALVVDNTLEGNFANWTTSGSIAVEEGQVMRIAESSPSATFTQAAGTIANRGKLEIVGGTFTGAGGQASGNPLELEGHISIAPSGSGSATLHLKTGAARLVSDIAPGYTVLNSGIPGLTHGQLAVQGSFTNRGTVELGSLDGTHGTIEATGGTLTNAGTVVFENTTNGPDGLNGPLVNEGVVSLENPVSGNGQITNAGQLSVPAAVTLEAESFTQGSGGTLSLARAASGSAPLVLSGTATLAGAATVSAAGLPSGAYPLILAHSRTGTFASSSVGGGSFGLAYTATGVELVPAGPISPPIKPPPAAGVLHIVSIKGGAGLVTVTLACAAGGGSCPAAVSVALVERLHRGRVVALSAATKPSRRTVTIAGAGGGVTLAAGTSRTLVLKLNRAGIALLRSHRTLPALTTVTSAGKAVGSEAVRIKRPKKRAAKKH